MISSGTCKITFEIAGPSLSPFLSPLIPDDIRGMAGWVIDQCVTRSGIGGFVTNKIINMVNYISEPATNFQGPFRKHILGAIHFLSALR